MPTLLNDTQKLVMFKSFGFAATPFKGLVVCLEEAGADPNAYVMPWYRSKAFTQWYIG